MPYRRHPGVGRPPERPVRRARYRRREAGPRRPLHLAESMWQDSRMRAARPGHNASTPRVGRYDTQENVKRSMYLCQNLDTLFG